MVVMGFWVGDLCEDNLEDFFLPIKKSIWSENWNVCIFAKVWILFWFHEISVF